jgi:hypothetical protein
MRLQRIPVARLGRAVIGLSLALGLSGCAGVVLLGALGSAGAAGGLAVTEKDREARAGTGSDSIPPAQRVPPSQQTTAPAVEDTQPRAEPRQAVTVQPVVPR